MKEHLTKLLIIDDELLLRNGIKYLCNWEEYGFTIAGEASNGLEGLKMIEAVMPDIVITDILMSVMDGIQLTQKIKEQYPWIPIIVLSSYDNFDYVKSLFKLGVTDYLLKPTLEKEELLALLNRLKTEPVSKSDTFQASSTHTFKELLHGLSPEHDSALLRFRESCISFSQEGKYLLLCGSLFGEKTFFTFEKQISLLLLEQPGCYLRVSCISDQGKLCLLLQLRQGEPSIEAQYVDMLAGALTKEIREPVIFSMSKPFSSLAEIQKHYADCCALLEYRFYFPEKRFIDSRDMKSHHSGFPGEAFRKTLDPLNLSAAHHILKQYVKNAVRFPSAEVYTLKKQIENALYSLIQTLTAAGFETSSLNLEKIRYFKLIDKAEDYHVLENVLQDFFVLTEAAVTDETQKRESDLFYRIQAYILENCSRELKLSDIANTFHLNYTYLSSLFFQKTNEHFPEYLNKIRIEKAKRLLQTEPSTIQSVSEQAGFINQGYFSKIFKKYVGLSPKEYQKIYRKKT